MVTLFPHQIKRKTASNVPIKWTFAQNNFHTGSSCFTADFWVAVRICVSNYSLLLWVSSHPFVPAAQQLISSSDNNKIHAVQLADHQWNAEWADNRTRFRIFIPTTTLTPGITLPRRAWVRLNRLRTGVGRFRSCLYKWGMASSVACECGSEEPTVDHVVLQCPIHRPPHGLNGLTVLDDETIEWLLNTCSEIWCGQAVVKTTTGSNDEEIL